MAEETTSLEDALANAHQMNVKLNVFEGPLDLLLFLIRKSEIDIYDIPIAEVTSQYMGVLRSMKNMSLDIAGEFFVMAATLMYIKSRMLLPADERPQNVEDDSDSEIDPRWQLVEQLLEYKKVKQASAALEDMIAARQNYGERKVLDKDMLKSERPLANSDKIEVWTVFNLILRRLAEKLVEGRISSENVTISDRMEYILAKKEKSFTFTSLFDGKKTSVQNIIATFLALLELTRMHKLRLTQNISFDEIYCERLDENSRMPEKIFDTSDISDYEGGGDFDGEISEPSEGLQNGEGGESLSENRNSTERI